MRSCCTLGPPQLTAISTEQRSYCPALLVRSGHKARFVTMLPTLLWWVNSDDVVQCSVRGQPVYLQMVRSKRTMNLKQVRVGQSDVEEQS